MSASMDLRISIAWRSTPVISRPRNLPFTDQCRDLTEPLPQSGLFPCSRFTLYTDNLRHDEFCAVETNVSCPIAPTIYRQTTGRTTVRDFQTALLSTFRSRFVRCHPARR